MCIRDSDYAHGQKKKVEELRRSKILRDNHVLTFDMFAGKPEADVEDVIGWRNYLALVNACYGLDGMNALDEPEVANERVAKKMQERFGTMPPGVPEFDHYTVSEFLIRNGDGALAKMPDLDAALDRFENIFKQLNEMLRGRKTRQLASGRSKYELV